MDQEKMSKIDRLRIFDSTTLKLIAMISMVFDHVGDMFYPGLLWPRMVGRIAMPVFSFCIAEGYLHTKDKNRYLSRMGIFAIISEIPFDLAFSNKIDIGHQNIMLTFFLSILGLKFFDMLRGEKDPETGKYKISKTVLGCMEILSMSIIAMIVKADYTVFAVIAVFLFYILSEKKHIIRTGVGTAFLALTRTMGYYCTA